MHELIDFRTRAWAVLAVVIGVILFVGLELIDEPNMTPAQMLLELLSIAPIVITSVGVALLFRVAQRQRDEQLEVMHDLEIARVQGRRWRSEARSYLDGLGAAIETQEPDRGRTRSGVAAAQGPQIQGDRAGTQR